MTIYLIKTRIISLKVYKFLFKEDLPGYINPFDESNRQTPTTTSFRFSQTKMKNNLHEQQLINLNIIRKQGKQCFLFRNFKWNSFIEWKTFNQSKIKKII